MRRILTLSLIAAVSQALDSATFAAVVSAHGIVGESNPVAVALYERAGLGGILTEKTLVVFTVIGAAYLFTRLDRRWMSVVLLSMFALLGMLGGLVNALAGSML